MRTKSKKKVTLAVVNGSDIRVEGDAKLEFMRDGMKCCMKFFFGRRLQKTGALRQRDRGRRNRVLLTCPRVPMSRKIGVFVVQLSAGEGKYAGFQDAGFTSDVREFRGHIQAEVKFDVRKAGCLTRIESVDDDEHKGLVDREAQEE